jgi:hypothetical protein
MAGLTSGCLGPYKFDRSARDRKWALAFAALWALCLGAGIYTITGKHSQYSDAQVAELPASACPREWLSSEPPHRRSLLSGAQHSQDHAAATVVAVVWTLISIGGSLLLGAAFLSVIRRHAERAVHATMVLQVRGAQQGFRVGWMLHRAPGDPMLGRTNAAVTELAGWLASMHSSSCELIA